MYVVVNSLEAIQRIRLRIDRWEDDLAGTNAENIFVTTTETVHLGSTVHSRMFAPTLGISEDPATGSASGPLGAYLLKYGLAQGGDMVSEQGFEMGRPSFIHIEVRRSGDDSPTSPSAVAALMSAMAPWSSTSRARVLNCARMKPTITAGAYDVAERAD